LSFSSIEDAGPDRKPQIILGMKTIRAVIQDTFNVVGQKWFYLIVVLGNHCGKQRNNLVVALG
jgi:hypothetical protein